MSQRNYALQILEDSGFLDSKPVKTPMNTRVDLSLSDDTPMLTDITGYRRLIGRLLYLTITHPYITFAVYCLSQFVHSPRDKHLQAAHHLLHCIKSNPRLGLLYPSSSSVHLRAFSDADWGTCTDSRRSITGYCVFVGDALVA